MTDTDWVTSFKRCRLFLATSWVKRWWIRLLTYMNLMSGHSFIRFLYLLWSIFQGNKNTWRKLFEREPYSKGLQPKKVKMYEVNMKYEQAYKERILRYLGCNEFLFRCLPLFSHLIDFLLLYLGNWKEESIYKYCKQSIICLLSDHVYIYIY